MACVIFISGRVKVQAEKVFLPYWASSLCSVTMFIFSTLSLSFLVLVDSSGRRIYWEGKYILKDHFTDFINYKWKRSYAIPMVMSLSKWKILQWLCFPQGNMQEPVIYLIRRWITWPWPLVKLHLFPLPT